MDTRKSIEMINKAVSPSAITSDCAPHWGPPGFLEWVGYATLWNRLVQWLGEV